MFTDPLSSYSRIYQYQWISSSTSRGKGAVIESGVCAERTYSCQVILGTYVQIQFRGYATTVGPRNVMLNSVTKVCLLLLFCRPQICRGITNLSLRGYDLFNRLSVFSVPGFCSVFLRLVKVKASFHFGLLDRPVDVDTSLVYGSPISSRRDSNDSESRSRTTSAIMFTRLADGCRRFEHRKLIMLAFSAGHRSGILDTQPNVWTDI